MRSAVTACCMIFLADRTPVVSLVSFWLEIMGGGMVRDCRMMDHSFSICFGEACMWRSTLMNRSVLGTYSSLSRNGMQPNSFGFADAP